MASSQDAQTSSSERSNGQPGSVPASGKAGKSRKNKRIPVIAGALAVAGLITAALLYIHFSHFESTDDAFIDGHIIPISPKVSGQVTDVYIDDNVAVKAGEVLVKIDPRDYEAKLAEQRAKAAAAQAQARRAAADAKRYQEIYKNDGISKQQLDTAEANAATTQAEFEKESAAARQDELNLSYTKITAPEDGRVTKKSVEPGQYVQPGQTLLSLVPKRVWVTANFKETQLTYMRPGQSVEIKVDAYPGRNFSGHVDSIQSGTGERFSVMPPENATGNYVKVVQRVPVKIVIDTPPDPNFNLSPGMSVEPRVRVK